MKTFTCPVSYSSITFISIMYPTYIQDEETQEFEISTSEKSDEFTVIADTNHKTGYTNEFNSSLSQSIENHSNEYNKILNSRL